MMELFSNLWLGFATVMTPMNLGLCFAGVLLGTLVGVLPGLGPTATIAILLPITFTLYPTGAFVMLAGIYYGSQYGGSTTAILINLPGEASSVVTALDGYQMARQGRAGAALAIAAIGSFVAGTVSTGLIAIAAKPLTQLAQNFGPAEYFSLMVVGLAAAILMARGDVLKALLATLFGVCFSLVGTEISSGTSRFTFGITELSTGLDFVAVAMGLFGVAEIIRNLEGGLKGALSAVPVSSLMPSRSELRMAAPAIGRGTLVGSLLGILPGGGALLSSFASYALEKRLAANPSRFGKGAIEGVAGPESANNAGAQTAFIPMLTLGIPANIVMALMIGALMIHGIQPGPNMLVTQPGLFWGVIVSMWIGNLMLLVINLPLIGLWVKLAQIRYSVLFPIIILVSCIGVYSVSNSAFDVGVMAIFGVIGYALTKLGFELTPLVLGFVLGPMMEDNMQRALTFARGDPTIFVTRPISGALLAIAAAAIVLALLPAMRKRREVIFED